MKLFVNIQHKTPVNNQINNKSRIRCKNFQSERKEAQKKKKRKLIVVFQFTNYEGNFKIQKRIKFQFKINGTKSTVSVQCAI